MKRGVHDGVLLVLLVLPVSVLVAAVSAGKGGERSGASVVRGPNQSAAEHSEQRQPPGFVNASIRDEPSAELSLHAGDAEAVGLVRDARREGHGPRARCPRRQRAEPAVARARSLAAALPPRSNLGGPESRRTLRGVPPLAEPLRRLLVGLPHPELRDAELRDARYAIALRHGGAGPVRDPHGGRHRRVGIPGVVGQRPLRVPFSRWSVGVVARCGSGTRRRGAGRPRSTLPAVRLRGIGPPGSREHDPRRPRPSSPGL